MGFAKVVSAVMGKATGEYPDAEQLAKTITPISYDPTGEKLIAGMDAAGVDISCIFTVDFGLATGEPEIPVEDQNRMIAEAAKRFPGRLIPFFAIDPRRAGSPEMFSRAVEDWDMRGLKFHSTSGYFPSDEVCYPLYEKCMEYGLPVLIHTGSIIAPLKGRYSQPIYVDDVAADFPELPIIMAHAGHPEWEQALMIASLKPNVYLDFSALESFFVAHPGDFYRRLRRIIDDIGPWRVFFGSDSPLFNLVCPIDAWVKAIAEPDLSSCADASFTEKEKDIVLGKAFARLMGIQAT
ncbi:MAG: amidohydrolase family protein [Actinobacteria bacterium]|nr:amidohydrolase family protein [Actinomycetota bacterium]